MVLNDVELNMIKALLYLNFKFDNGGYHGEEFSSAHEAVDKWISGLSCAIEKEIKGHVVPLAVKKAIVKKFLYLHGMVKACEVIYFLQYCGSYYGFMHAGMFHGVEPDGYIHT